MTDPSRLAQVRARLELPLVRRAAGLLEGHHRSIFKGHGQDFDDLSLYSPGDDIGDIDWKSSARAGIPVIRRFVRQSNLTTVIAADTGRNMAASAPSGEAKGEVALFMASMIAYLARDRGDRVALVAGDAERLRQRPPRSSTQDLEAMLHELAAAYSVIGPESDLEAVLGRVDDAFHRRSLVIVLTDEAQPRIEHLPILRRIRTRHSVLVLAVADADPFRPVLPSGEEPAEMTEPDGRRRPEVRDVSGGLYVPRYLQARPDLVRATARATKRQRDQVREVLLAAQVNGMVAGSTQDVLPQFIRLLGRHHAGR